MANLLETIRRGRAADFSQISLEEWASYFQFNGLSYPLGLNQTFTGQAQEQIPPVFSGIANGAFKANGIVYACVVARNWLFSEAVFKFRPLSSYAPGDLFGSGALSLLEEPWTGGTTRKLLQRMDMEAQLAGNSYVYRESAQVLRLLRPDWVTIVLGSPRPDGKVGDIDTEVIGYAYRPNGVEDPVPILPEQIAHFMPVPDPVFPWRGMSWLQPVLDEVTADGAAMTHKRKFFENGATANMVVTVDPSTSPEDFKEFMEMFKQGHRGAAKAYETLFLAGGADAKVVGADLKQLDFKVTQGHGETRICAAARIPPIIVGVSEGLASATYSNYGQARRAYADATMRPLWASACETLATHVDGPAGSTLWYDERQISFLQEDQKDLAEIQQTQAQTMRALIDAGYEPTSVVAAVQSGDMGALKHTGLYSVQLQPPGTEFKQSSNGNGNGVVPAVN